MRLAAVRRAGGLCRSMECRLSPRFGKSLRRVSGAADPPAAPILSSSVVVTRQRMRDKVRGPTTPLCLGLGAGRAFTPAAAGVQFDYEVLLMRRHAGSSFMPGLFVFPGGQTDMSDFAASWRHLVGEEEAGSGAARALELGTDPGSWGEGRDSLGLRIGALRELFEEAGAPCPLAGPMRGDAAGGRPC